MRGKRTGVFAIGVALVVATAACTASTPAPPTARLTLEQAQRSPRGGWINIVTVSGAVGGELLAVEERALVLESRRGLQRIPLADIRSVSLSWYEASNAGVLGWNVLGTLSTLSHGFFLIFTAPLLWMVPGTVNARGQSKQGHESFDVSLADPAVVQELVPYARFPAGLPPGFEPAASPPEGGAGEACYPNATCNAGLSCQGGRCQ